MSCSGLNRRKRSHEEVAAPTRERHLQIVLDTCTAVQGIVRRLIDAKHEDGEDPVSLSTARTRATHELHSLGATHTPYGCLIQAAGWKGKGGVEHTIYFISPFALLWHISMISAGFGNFLRSCLGDGVGHLVFYIDGCSPGKSTRPDARKIEAVYWTILEYPSWFRSRICGWFGCIFELESQLKLADISQSSLIRFILRIFLAPEPGAWNFEETGVMLRIEDVDFNFKAKCGPFLADFEAVKFVCSQMGASGRSPCPYCRNIIGRWDYFEDDYLVHMTSSEYGRFHEHDAASFLEMVDTIEAARDGPKRHIRGVANKSWGEV
jgi:hypothetical protein